MARTRFVIIAIVWVAIVMQAAWVLPGSAAQTGRKYHDTTTHSHKTAKQKKKKLRRKHADSLNTYLKDTTKKQQLKK